MRSTPKSWPITSIRVCGNRARSAAAREYRPRPAYFGGRSDGFAPRRDAIDISRCLQIRAYRERNLCCDPCLPSQMCVAHVRGFASYRRDWRSRRRAPEGPESVRRGFSPLQGNAQAPWCSVFRREGVFAHDHQAAAGRARPQVRLRKTLRQRQPEIVAGRPCGERNSFRESRRQLLLPDGLVPNRPDDLVGDTGTEPMRERRDHERAGICILACRPARIFRSTAELGARK